MTKKITRTAAHSVRTDDAMWGRAKARAAKEGHTINHVINEILDGYGRGLINLPKVQITKQYETPRPVAAKDKPAA